MSKKCFDEKICTNKVIVKVSSTFSKVAGDKGTESPCRPPQRAKTSYITQKRSRGEEMRQHFRGARTQPRPFLTNFNYLSLKNVPVERF